MPNVLVGVAVGRIDRRADGFSGMIHTQAGANEAVRVCVGLI